MEKWRKCDLSQYSIRWGPKGNGLNTALLETQLLLSLFVWEFAFGTFRLYQISKSSFNLTYPFVYFILFFGGYKKLRFLPSDINWMLTKVTKKITTWRFLPEELPGPVEQDCMGQVGLGLPSIDNSFKINPIKPLVHN